LKLWYVVSERARLNRESGRSAAEGGNSWDMMSWGYSMDQTKSITTGEKSLPSLGPEEDSVVF